MFARVRCATSQRLEGGLLALDQRGLEGFGTRLTWLWWVIAGLALGRRWR
jgi:hypothetical protein